MTQFNLHEPFQSAYRKNHSTETALVRVQNDILTALDKNEAAVLVLLDLAAAFDTVYHNMLLGRLSEFGITGTVWNCLKSYLSPRSQRVRVMNACSYATFLIFVVPQGSVLGPVLFTLHTIPLGEICRRHEVFYHLYADDTQLFCTFSVGNDMELEEARRRIQNCISEIKMWMSLHFLKLNDAKTEVILITPRSNHNKISLPTIQVDNSDVTPSESARNSGVMFDANMSMATQITIMCRSAWYQLRNIREVRHSLTTEATIRLVCALVFS